MFATFNLPFTPVEITDDSLMTSAMTPDVAPTAEFAELLRLRADTAHALSTGPGQMLPQGGSDLPLQALPVELEAPDAPELSLMPQAPKPGALSQAPELAALPQVPVVTTPAAPTLTPPRPTREQPLPASLTLETDLPVPTTPGPAIRAPESLVATASSREGLASAEPRPLPTIQQDLPRPVTPVQIQETVASLSGKLELNAPPLREPALTMQAQPRVAADVDMPIIEMPRRPEASPLPAVSVEEISDVFKARPTVTRPVQVLNVQPQPQQAVVMSAPTPTVSTDTGFAAAVQQASDLVSVPVRDPAWAEQIGERVLMMAGRQMTSAEIRLTPAELGPLRVQVSVDDGAANVTFQAQHAVTRDAIEQALPRLRELLAENGLSLGQASVGEQGVAEGQRDEPSKSPHSASGDAFDDDDAGDSMEPRRVVASDSLVDTFV